MEQAETFEHRGNFLDRKAGVVMKQKPDQTELKICRKTYEQPHMSERQIEDMKKKIDEAKMKNRRQRRKRSIVFRTTAAVTAVVAAFVILPNTSAGVAYAMENIPLLGRLVEVVTVRDYQYEDERNHADIEIPEIVAKDTVVENVQTDNDDIQTEEGSTETTVQVPDTVQENLKKSAEEINAEIQEISGSFIEEFKENLQSDWGYQDVVVKSEVVSTTQDYFTLKLICYMASGSGAEWNYYYTIDLNTGERLQLKNLFQEGADYVTPISENIKTQMREQMAADDMNHYWVDDEIDDLNFKEITDETAFYINESGKIVISFNEGDVAPMYMGVVTFEIPDEVVADIRK